MGNVSTKMETMKESKGTSRSKKNTGTEIRMPLMGSSINVTQLSSVNLKKGQQKLPELKGKEQKKIGK